MNTNWLKNKDWYISRLLMICSVLLVCATVVKAGYTFHIQGKTVENFASEQQQNEEILKKSVAASKEMADKLKKTNLFSAPDKAPPKPVCTGIIGNYAIINGKKVKVGEETGGAKLLSVGPKDVTIMWQGQETKLIPFAVANQGAPKSKPAPEAPQTQPSQSQAVVVSQPVQPVRMDEDEMQRRRDMRARFENMSEEERQQMRERFRNMSPEERRSMMGGRPGGRQDRPEGRRGRGRNSQ